MTKTKRVSTRARRAPSKHLQRVAIHESGHAWMLRHEGVQIDSVSIQPVGETLGQVRYSYDDLLSPECRMVIALSGPVAESKFRGVKVHWLSRHSDYSYAFDAGREIEAEEPYTNRWMVDAHVAFCEARLLAYFDNLDIWHEIKCLAALLLKKQVLSGKDAFEVMDSAKCWDRFDF
jgi:hypothetical protein